MSFRLRVLGLVMLVAVSATAATAWLTLRQAREQITASVTTDQAQIDTITSDLKAYGSKHGTWEGVADLVQRLHNETGQRIHLVTESGEVLVDTDTEENPNRATRPLGPVTAYVDPRPALVPAELAGSPVPSTIKAIRSYRAGVLFAACLTRNQLEVLSSPGAMGLPQFTANANADPATRETVASCDATAAEPGRDIRVDEILATGCVDSTDTGRKPTGAGIGAPGPDRTPATAPPTPDPAESIPVDACLAQTFTNQISDVAPPPVRVYLGAPKNPANSLTTGPLLAAAAGVAAVAILCTALLSHRVLRPIGTLTTAAHRLGQGDLSGRVPVEGNDELAELARSFNRMADSLQRGEERQRRLVADVAHELRSPLANLRGYLEALKDGVISPDPELFASLHEEAVLQQRIVDDLQELALAEAGKLAYHRFGVDLAELLETCRTAHLALAESAGVALRVQAEPVTVHADPDRLRQVVGNLITNALRATGEGGMVTLHAARAGTATALVRVVDNGSGIAPQALPHVFDRFWRADSARGRGTGGSGLGLAITHQIVTDHGGTISVASEPGAGTTFSIILPATEAGVGINEERDRGTPQA